MAKLTLANALKLGIEAQKIGQVQKADGYYTSILKVKPDHPAANYNLGVLAVSIGKPEQALGLFEKAFIKGWYANNKQNIQTVFGRASRTRTCDLPSPRRTRYQAAP